MSNVRKLGYFKPVRKQEAPRWKPGKKVPFGKKKTG